MKSVESIRDVTLSNANWILTQRYKSILFNATNRWRCKPTRDLVTYYHCQTITRQQKRPAKIKLLHVTSRQLHVSKRHVTALLIKSPRFSSLKALQHVILFLFLQQRADLIWGKPEARITKQIIKMKEDRTTIAIAIYNYSF